MWYFICMCSGIGAIGFCSGRLYGLVKTELEFRKLRRDINEKFNTVKK